MKRWFISWITGQNVQKLQILLFFAFCVASILNMHTTGPLHLRPSELIAYDSEVFGKKETMAIQKQVTDVWISFQLLALGDYFK